MTHDLTRRRVIFLGTATAVGAVMPGCDNLVLPQQDLIDSIDPITSNADFYVYSYSGPPDVDVGAWSVTFLDRGTEVASLDAVDLESLPSTTFEHTLQCIGSGPRNRLISNAEWSGAPLLDVLDMLSITVDPSVIQLVMHGADSYHTWIPITDLDRPVWLVWRMNGAALPHRHGAPARLIVPGRYGTKNVKWVTGIELSAAPHTGFWEAQGWNADATYLCNGFIMSPGNLTEYPVGPIRFVGTAHAGSVPITKVEISTDDGDTWQDATLDYSNGPNVWTLWSFDFDPPGAGVYAVRLRVTADDGSVADHPDATDVYDGYDGGMRVEVSFV